MSNCKQGDLAIIVAARQSENIGKLVEVVRPYPLGETFGSIDGKRVGRISKRKSIDMLWVIRSHGSPLLWSSSFDASAGLYMERAFGDRGLRPIPKLDEPESTTTDKELTV